MLNRAKGPAGLMQEKQKITFCEFGGAEFY